jgi:hypothetical protein
VACVWERRGVVDWCCVACRLRMTFFARPIGVTTRTRVGIGGFTRLLLEYHAGSMHQKGRISRELRLCTCRVSSSFCCVRDARVQKETDAG